MAVRWSNRRLGQERLTPPQQSSGKSAYFGRFEVDEAQFRVHHLIEASLDPTEVGLTYVRLVDLKDDLLTLSTTEKRFSTGTGSVNRLTWTRI